jgi:hypothetical protein
VRGCQIFRLFGTTDELSSQHAARLLAAAWLTSVVDLQNRLSIRS